MDGYAAPASVAREATPYTMANQATHPSPAGREALEQASKMLAQKRTARA
jgi:hypothetical protein